MVGSLLKLKGILNVIPEEKISSMISATQSQYPRTALFHLATLRKYGILDDNLRQALSNAL